MKTEARKEAPDTGLLERLHELALKIRVIEEGLAELYPLYEMKTPAHFCIGQEAIPAGVCAAIRRDDHLFSTYRSHGWYLAKGGDLSRMVAEMYGKVTGCSKGFGGSMHLLDLDAGFAGTSALVSGALPHAVGAAFNFRHRKSSQLAVSVFGDAATEEGIFTESVMFAVLRKLPVLFICENNDFAVNSHIKYRQAPVPIHQRVGAMGIPTVLVDGNDARAVHEASRAAVEHIRAGKGPYFIEATTYRILEHCGPNSDLALKTRDEELHQSWLKRDPIALLERNLDPKHCAKVKDRFKTDLAAAVAAARKAPFPHSLNPEEL